MTLSGLVEHFLLGVATPLTAACVIPLYPAFLAYLASADAVDHRRPVSLLGLLVVAGVLAFMAVVGVVFTYLLQESVNRVVADVSPVAFAVLAVVGAVLLVDPSGFSRVPTLEPPQSRYPALSAFSYGFFFGAIVIPCNPATISLFFARTPVLYDTHVESVLGFLAFGLGIGAPLLAFALLSEPFGRRVTRTLARYSSQINRATGAILLVVAAYYLLFVFDVVPWMG
ncbi:cytochrome c biogenesis protein CcdA [Natrialba sp. INN-245]|uniref:cytochrome c biogenesis CcdA family protein n=1 Tax=Natrialba sp. INN-245 TaxID=2690967 RepID=UPI0013135E04|nr:cytochrome c biogenesis protein CcdA [Natrialba sp. INN-245]MWV38671.1 cytochrome C biogenesis protein [Natrialba sp. INN-245]